MLHLPPKKIPRLFVKTFFGNKPVSDSDSDSDLGSFNIQRTDSYVTSVEVCFTSRTSVATIVQYCDMELET